jgi:hypothetical protein
MSTAWIPKLTATIAESASLSDAIQVNGAGICEISLPAEWTTGDLTLQASMNDSDFRDVYDKDGTELVIKAAAGRHIHINPADLPMLADAIKLRSGTSGTPVAQAAAREILVGLYGWGTS